MFSLLLGGRGAGGVVDGSLASICACILHPLHLLEGLVRPASHPHGLKSWASCGCSLQHGFGGLLNGAMEERVGGGGGGNALSPSSAHMLLCLL